MNDKEDILYEDEQKEEDQKEQQVHTEEVSDENSPEVDYKRNNLREEEGNKDGSDKSDPVTETPEVMIVEEDSSEHST